MAKRNRLTGFTLLAVLIIFLSGCGSQAADAPAGEEPAGPAPSEAEAASPAEEAESEESDSAELEAYPLGSPNVTDVVGNIRYEYSGDLAVRDIDGIRYVYYNDSSFFFCESGPVTLDQEALTEADMADFFAAAEQSFSADGWANGRLVSDIDRGEINGLEVWIGEIDMDHESGAAFTSSTAVLYHDGLLTTFTLISDVESYQTSVFEYADTLASLQAV